MSSWRRYSCYGLLIDSEIPLPDLGPAARIDTTADASGADVTIRLGTLDAAEAADLSPLGLWRRGDVCGIEVPDVGRYEARRGTEIVVDPLPDADPKAVRVFLLGSAMGATMMLRGALVLHGNAFRIGDACAVVVGHSGAGKSTLAAEFDRRGFDVLSDDVVPVDGAGLALPGYPRIKLWEDALDRLGRSTADLERIHDAHEKFQVPLERGALAPLPLRWVFVLEKHAGDDLRLEPAHGAVAFSLLHEHTYRNDLVLGDGAAAHLQQCAALLGRARLTRVLRPAATMTAESTAAAILALVDDDLSPALTSQETA
ncbi:hypothetical protein [Marmoricola sp. RAF53]|uniref:hypothetical protein n=1 Tax=Marmoricola sp. RAF53 TaxID=3233059 RepID=UPI003F94907A